MLSIRWLRILSHCLENDWIRFLFCLCRCIFRCSMVLCIRQRTPFGPYVPSLPIYYATRTCTEIKTIWRESNNPPKLLSLKQYTDAHWIAREKKSGNTKNIASKQYDGCLWYLRLFDAATRPNPRCYSSRSIFGSCRLMFLQLKSAPICPMASCESEKIPGNMRQSLYPPFTICCYRKTESSSAGALCATDKHEIRHISFCVGPRSAAADWRFLSTLDNCLRSIGYVPSMPNAIAKCRTGTWKIDTDSALKHWSRTKMPAKTSKWIYRTNHFRFICTTSLTIGSFWPRFLLLLRLLHRMRRSSWLRWPTLGRASRVCCWCRASFCYFRCDMADPL